jgi:hypothetical protein
MTLRYRESVGIEVPPTGKGLNVPIDDARNVSVLLLSELYRAGVFAGLELQKRISHPNDPPANRPVGLSFLAQIF